MPSILGFFARFSQFPSLRISGGGFDEVFGIRNDEMHQNVTLTKLAPHQLPLMPPFFTMCAVQKSPRAFFFGVFSWHGMSGWGFVEVFGIRNDESHQNSILTKFLGCQVSVIPPLGAVRHQFCSFLCVFCSFPATEFQEGSLMKFLAS